MKLDRRHFLSACAIGTALPACAAKAVGGQFTPEAFGAIGDGRTDDYDALQRMVSAVNAARGGSVAFAPGRSYFLNRFATAANPVANLTFSGCQQLTIEGNRATLSVKGDFQRDAFTTRSLAGLMVEDCRSVAIRNLELDGNVDQTMRIGQIGEWPSHGLIIASCSDVIIEGVFAHHFAADGLYIRDSQRVGPDGIHAASRRCTVRNSKFLCNARQGLSVIQLRGGMFDNCDFSHTGFIDERGTTGPYGTHSPGAGVDVEANKSPLTPARVDLLTGELIFRNCRMVGNAGASFVSGKYARGHAFAERVRLEACYLECNRDESGGRDGFIFDVPGGEVTGCTLQMRDKAAFIGWYPESDASPRFVGNTVYGRNPKANYPFFLVRPTRGAPLIEGNRFIGQQGQAKPRGGAWLAMIENPNATVRNNRFVIPAQAYERAARGGAIPAVFAKARLMEGNSYETNLVTPQFPEAFFGIVYAAGTLARGEIFRGTRPGVQDSVRPLLHKTRAAPIHDTRRPWTK